MDIKSKVEQLMTLNGVNGRKLAKLIGRSPSNVSQLLGRNYQKLTIKQLELLARALNTSVSELTKDDKEINKQYDIPADWLDIFKKVFSYPEEIRVKILEEFSLCVEVIALALKHRR